MGAFKLGKMTFGSLFKKPETIMYPVVTKPQPVGLKGHIVIDSQSCIVCGMCDRNCSTDCIKVDRKARTWEINPFACVQCGYCVTVCPKNCLTMDPNYFPVAVEKSSTIVSIPEQGVSEKPAKKEPEGSRAQADQLVKKAQEQPDSPDVAREQDEQLQKLLDIMDAEKAQRVKAALGK